MLAAAVAGLGALLAVAALLTHSGSAAGGAPVAIAAGQPLEPAAQELALIHVSGAVARPGLYRLSPAARVADAVAAAGGSPPTPIRGGSPTSPPACTTAARSTCPTAARAPVGCGVAAAAGGSSVNTAFGRGAGATVPGMPAGLAEAIVEARDEWGPFTALSELRQRLDVDPATVAGLRLYLVVRR